MVSKLASLVVATWLLCSVARSEAIDGYGTLRPNVYIGVRSTDPQSLLSGVIWSGDANAPHSHQDLRHTCEMGNQVVQTFIAHDGHSFSVQQVNDTKHNIAMTSTFVAHGENEWTLRLEASSLRRGKEQSVYLYHYLVQQQDAYGPITVDTDVFNGKDHYGDFQLDVQLESDTAALTAPAHIAIPIMEGQGAPWRAKEMISAIVNNVMQQKESRESASVLSSPLLMHQLPNLGGEGNLAFYQQALKTPFSLDIRLKRSAQQASPSVLHELIQKKQSDFDSALSQGLCQRVDKKYEQMIREAASSLLGGIGFFHGDARVEKTEEELAFVDAMSNEEEMEDIYESEITVHEEHEGHSSREDRPVHSLLTATPSRSFFPRGFLWDEGFHLMLIKHLSPELAQQIMSSWLALQDEDGWIAREQILGDEARSKVPEEFQLQRRHFANPPTLFFLLNDASMPVESEVLKKWYPALKGWYDWFRRTQKARWPLEKKGVDPDHLYQWQGRNGEHILTSGFDDYPRAPVGAAHHVHVDITAWVGYMAKTLWQVSERIDRPLSESKVYHGAYDAILSNLKHLHWHKDGFYDVYMASASSKTHQHAVHQGYVSFLPLFLQLLPPDDPATAKLIDELQQPKMLSDYGLMSLSREDAAFGSGENYWRGPIWMNMQYLALKALYERYRDVAGATTAYQSLRDSIIDTVYTSWSTTHQFWEQYDPRQQGKGVRSHPFTGWTSLIANIVAEKY